MPVTHMSARKELDDLLVPRSRHFVRQVLHTLVEPLRDELHIADYVVLKMRRNYMRVFLDKEHETFKAELGTKGLALRSCWGRCL